MERASSDRRQTVWGQFGKGFPFYEADKATVASRILTISGFTRQELIRFNGVAPGKIGLLPCALDPLWSEEFRHLVM